MNSSFMEYFFGCHESTFNAAYDNMVIINEQIGNTTATNFENYNTYLDEFKKSSDTLRKLVDDNFEELKSLF
ncbi:MAG: hypothetical protein GY714_21705 [Desulfobacterales bacterium]|nr:hypothetical protein [Desulfobacterales bacterium]MCP4163368.1 hypothetical protein [Deltaproteobacteria bacterium]